MTADEFRKILNRFQLHLDMAGSWIHSRSDLDENPGWYDGLDAVWRDLNRECALMKDAERRQRCLACDCGEAGGLPREDDIAVFP